MTFELTLLAAFALFAVFAWLKITELSRKARYYRGQCRELFETIDCLHELAGSDNEHLVRLEDEREVLERHLNAAAEVRTDLREENALLKGRLSGYWLTAN